PDRAGQPAAREGRPHRGGGNPRAPHGREYVSATSPFATLVFLSVVRHPPATHGREYVSPPVLFALVLFLVAVGQRFRLSGVRLAVLAIALTLLAYALYSVVTLPRF